MRGRLIHHYFGIDYDILWDIIQNEVGSNLDFLAQMLADLEEKDL